MWRSVALWIVVCAVASSGLAAQRGSSPAEPASSELDRKCTVEVYDRPLKTVLADLSKVAGIRITTDTAYEDRWVCIRARERTVGQVMRALADLYQDVWVKEVSRSGSAYLLRRSPRRLRLQQQLTSAWRETLQDQLIQTIRSVLQDGPEDWLTGGSPNREFGNEIRARAEILGQLPEAWVSGLLQGRHIRIGTVEAQGPLGKALWGFAMNHTYAEAGPDAARITARSSFEFHSEQYTSDGQVLRDVRFTVGAPGAAQATYNLPLHPERFRANFAARIADLVLEPEVTDQQNVSRLLRLARDTSQLTDESGANGLGTRGEQVKRLAEWLNVDVVTDSHLRPPSPRARLSGLGPVESVSRVAETVAANWRVRGPFLYLRSKYWWLEDAADPPATKTEAWMRAQRSRGHLNLEEMAGVAALDDIQITFLALAVPGVQIATRSWFKLWGALPKPQRDQMRTDAGLPAARASVRAREKLLFAAGGNIMAGNPAVAAGLVAGRLRAGEGREPAPFAWFQLDLPPDPRGHTLLGPFRYSFELPRRRLPPMPGGAGH